MRAGQVTVNGAVITELGTKADPERDRIKVRGKLLRFPESSTYLVLNKPAGVVSTMSDPEGRKTLRDFVHGARGHVYPVGRLDYHAEGLLLLTNDGVLANAVLQAAALPQAYWLKVKGALSHEELRQVGREAGARLRQVKSGPNPWYEATLTDARRDLLRNCLFRAGHPVEKLKRIRLGNLELGGLAPGEYRYLAAEEVAGLSRVLTRGQASGRGKHPKVRGSDARRARGSGRRKGNSIA